MQSDKKTKHVNCKVAYTLSALTLPSTLQWSGLGEIVSYWLPTGINTTCTLHNNIIMNVWNCFFHATIYKSKNIACGCDLKRCFKLKATLSYRSISHRHLLSTQSDHRTLTSCVAGSSRGRQSIHWSNRRASAKSKSGSATHPVIRSSIMHAAKRRVISMILGS